MSIDFESPYPHELAALAEPAANDKPKCECGVFAVCAHDINVPEHVATALDRMQHRGKDSAGIAVYQDGEIRTHTGNGLADSVFTSELITDLQTELAIGHNRYRTSGSATAELNQHPIWVEMEDGELALAHNGNFTNTAELRQDVADSGNQPKGSSDSELAALWLAHVANGDIEDRLVAFHQRAEGAYSLAVMTGEQIYGMRDGHGVRPLSIGRVPGRKGYALSSETRVFRSLGYNPEREVAPGEIVQIGFDGFETIRHLPDARQALCMFELVYFSGPDSEIGGEYVNKIRKTIGRQLAREDLARGTLPEVDVAFGVPESGWPMGEGYADEAGFHMERGLIANKTKGRSFIDASDPRRIVEAKFNPLPDVVGGKRVLLVDDSIVRSNTMPYIIRMLRDAGATEVHVRAGCPPLVDTCHMGVNIASRDELIALKESSLEGIRQEIGAHSLQYLSVEGLLESANKEFNETCMACMTGVYPFEVKDKQEDYVVSSDLRDIPKLIDFSLPGEHTGGESS